MRVLTTAEGTRSNSPRMVSTSESVPLSIVHLLAPALAGGLESVVAALAVGQRATGHSVHVVTLEQEGGAVEPHIHAVLRRGGVPVERLPVKSRNYRDERSRFAALLDHLRPVVVHTHGCRPDVIHGDLARRAGAARVSTIHGITNERDFKGRVYHWLEKQALRRFEAVVAVSRPLEARLRQWGIGAARIHVVPNAYAPSSAPLGRGEARAALGIAGRQYRVGWVGRLSREKGADVMLAALARLPEECTLSIVGEGPEGDRLRRQCEELGVASRVQWHGPVSDAGRLMAAFDVFVLSSRTEGTPIALFEAMAAGTPVVATDVGGVPDVVRGEEGLLVPSEGSAALARAIARVRQDPDAAARRALAAQRRVASRYDPQRWFAAYESVYQAALARARSRPA